MTIPQPIPAETIADLHESVEKLARIRRGQLLEIPESAYHADPAPEPSFSAGIGKVLIDQSPAHAYLAHPRLGGKPSEPTKAMEFGSLVHALVLGRGAKIVECQFDDWKTKAAQAQRDCVRSSGALPVLSKDIERATSVLGSFLAAQSVLDPDGLWPLGVSERVVINDHANLRGNGLVFARSMMDRVYLDHDHKRAKVWDLKTTANANPDALEQVVYDMHYDMQAACYEWQVETAFPEFTGRVEFEFVFLETEPPFSVVPVVLDQSFRMIGKSKLGRAWDTWCRCIASGKWPSYPTTRTLIAPPTWALSRELDEEIAGSR